MAIFFGRNNHNKFLNIWIVRTKWTTIGKTADRFLEEKLTQTKPQRLRFQEIKLTWDRKIGWEKKYKTLFAKCTRNYCWFLDLVLLFCSDYFDALGKGRFSFHSEESLTGWFRWSPKEVLKKKNGFDNATCIFCLQRFTRGWLAGRRNIKELGLGRLEWQRPNISEYLRLRGYDTVKGTEIGKLEKVCGG